MLGAGFDRTDIELGSDVEGALVATLVRAEPRRRGLWRRFFTVPPEFENVDVLYVHGWNDYFFQRGMADFFTERGARFFALDLRKYGRSLREGQTPGYIEDLADYDLEIARALELMGYGHRLVTDNKQAASETSTQNRSRLTSERRLLLYGHSTGGLTLSLWSHRHRGIADGLLLNSPWLALQGGNGLRRAMTPVVNLRARFAPHDSALPHLDLGYYTRAQALVSDPAEQQLINRAWRLDKSPQPRVGWLNAILSGHGQISEGIDVGAPVGVLLSDRSIFSVNWRDEMLGADTVIDVDRVARAALQLGRSVTVERIGGALHNVLLSAPAPQHEAYRCMERWIRGWLAGFEPAG